MHILSTTGQFLVKVHGISSQRCQDAETNKHTVQHGGATARQDAGRLKIQTIATRYWKEPLMTVIL